MWVVIRKIVICLGFVVPRSPKLQHKYIHQQDVIVISQTIDLCDRVLWNITSGTADRAVEEDEQLHSQTDSLKLETDKITGWMCLIPG